MVPLLLVTLVPLLVLYGGILVFELHPVAYLQENWGQLPRIIAAGLILAVYYGLVGLAVASLTGRRAFAIGGYLLVLIAPTLVAGADRRGARRPRLALPAAAVGAADQLRRVPVPGHGGDPELDGGLGRRLPGGGRARRGRAAAPLPAGGRGVTGAPALTFEGVSRWYGDTVALADVSFELGPGVTGLLGHNGAGKSTALKLCAGFTQPSSGAVRVLGTDLAASPDAYRRIGIAHDRDALWPFLTARDLVALCARLRGVADPDAAAARALAEVGLEDAADRKVKGFSHGMRQRVKLAQALAHDPELLLLDEPLNGLDPAQRRGVVALIHRLGDEGRTVLVSSHVLHEVERMAPRVLVLVNGHLVASGSTAAIRELIADRPRSIRLEATEGRALARELVGRRAGGVGALRRRARSWWSRPTSSASAATSPGWPATWAPACAASSRSATTSRASTPTCTSAPAGWAGDLVAGLPPHAAEHPRRRARRWRWPCWPSSP